MPMTRRVLKKRSKQALAILQAHYPRSITMADIFPAERDNYHGVVIRCTHGSGDPSLVKGRPHCNCTNHPLKGTPMTGGMSGGEQPEWDERTVLEVFWDVIAWTGRAETMTDRQWRRALAVARVKPITGAEMAAMFADDGAEQAEAA